MSQGLMSTNTNTPSFCNKYHRLYYLDDRIPFNLTNPESLTEETLGLYLSRTLSRKKKAVASSGSVLFYHVDVKLRALFIALFSARTLM